MALLIPSKATGLLLSTSVEGPAQATLAESRRTSPATPTSSLARKTLRSKIQVMKRERKLSSRLLISRTIKTPRLSFRPSLAPRSSHLTTWPTDPAQGQSQVEASLFHRRRPSMATNRPLQRLASIQLKESRVSQSVLLERPSKVTLRLSLEELKHREGSQAKMNSIRLVTWLRLIANRIKSMGNCQTLEDRLVRTLRANPVSMEAQADAKVQSRRRPLEAADS